MRYYIIRDGERIYKDTVEAIARVAQKVADDLGVSVPVYHDHTGTGFGGHKVAKIKARKMRPNPAPKATGTWIVKGTKAGKVKTVRCESIGKASAARRVMLNTGFYPVSMSRPK